MDQKPPKFSYHKWNFLRPKPIFLGLFLKFLDLTRLCTKLWTLCKRLICFINPLSCFCIWHRDGIPHWQVFDTQLIYGTTLSSALPLISVFVILRYEFNPYSPRRYFKPITVLQAAWPREKSKEINILFINRRKL